MVTTSLADFISRNPNKSHKAFKTYYANIIINNDNL